MSVLIADMSPILSRFQQVCWQDDTYLPEP